MKPVTLDDLAKMDAREKEIENERAELQDEIDPLKKRLTNMILMKKKGQEVSDLSAKIRFIDGEIRELNLEINQLQRDRGRLKKGVNFQAQLDRPKILTKYGIFHMVAKETLPEDLYLRIWNIVEGRMRMDGAQVIDDETGQEISK